MGRGPCLPGLRNGPIRLLRGSRRKRNSAWRYGRCRSLGLRRWPVNYRSRIRIRLGPEVDASGELADGRTFTDVSGLRTLLTKDEDALARNLVRQLLIYATGTGIRFSDRAAIEAIIARTKPTHHGVRDLLHNVVASTLFHTK